MDTVSNKMMCIVDKSIFAFNIPVRCFCPITLSVQYYPLSHILEDLTIYLSATFVEGLIGLKHIKTFHSDSALHSVTCIKKRQIHTQKRVILPAIRETIIHTMLYLVIGKPFDESIDIFAKISAFTVCYHFKWHPLCLYILHDIENEGFHNERELNSIYVEWYKHLLEVFIHSCDIYEESCVSGSGVSFNNPMSFILYKHLVRGYNRAWTIVHFDSLTLTMLKERVLRTGETSIMKKLLGYGVEDGDWEKKTYASISKANGVYTSSKKRRSSFTDTLPLLKVFCNDTVANMRIDPYLFLRHEDSGVFVNIECDQPKKIWILKNLICSSMPASTICDYLHYLQYGHSRMTMSQFCASNLFECEKTLPMDYFMAIQLRFQETGEFTGAKRMRDVPTDAEEFDNRPKRQKIA